MKFFERHPHDFERRVTKNAWYDKNGRPISNNYGVLLFKEVTVRPFLALVLLV